MFGLAKIPNIYGFLCSAQHNVEPGLYKVKSQPIYLKKNKLGGVFFLEEFAFR